jgi:hypothetical protein
MRFFVLLLFTATAYSQIPAFPGAEGFGALATGGRGGDVYHVTTLEDSGDGSLRDGVETATGPRTIVFDISGTIILKDILWIKKSNLTIAGQTAPGDGICIRDYSVNIKRANDIIIRYIRIRLGDIQTLIKGKPTSSTGLDVVSIDDSKNIIIDHCSLSWSCDEVFGIVQNENVTIQWCLVAEPLGDPLLHPYGNSHAYGLNNSANTLSVHHCLMSNYVMRGPEFEPNDAVNDQGYQVQMEAVNNVMFDYKKSGSRYKTGIEDNPEEASDILFQFHFLNNYYIRKPFEDAPEIHAVTKLGVTDQLKVFVDGNIGPNRQTNDLNPWKSVWVERGPNILEADSSIKAQMAFEPLFSSPAPIIVQLAEEAYESVLLEAGCSTRRDSVDIRILNDVTNRKYRDYLHSQETVGGWPVLKTTTAPLDTDRDGMPDWWEDLQGLDKVNAEDRNDDFDLNGYTNLEEFLNSDLITKVEKTIPPEEYGFLLQNYPNPFNSMTKIEYDVPFAEIVKIDIFNLSGQHVKTLLDEYKLADSYDIIWDGSDDNGYSLSTGTYFYKIEIGTKNHTKKMIKLK